MRIKAARFPGHKTLEDFDAQPSADRNLIAHLGTSTFVSEAKNVVLLGPPGTGKTHLAVALGVHPANHGHRVLFDRDASDSLWLDGKQNHPASAAHAEWRVGPAAAMSRSSLERTAPQ